MPKMVNGVIAESRKISGLKPLPGRGKGSSKKDGSASYGGKHNPGKHSSTTPRGSSMSHKY